MKAFVFFAVIAFASFAQAAGLTEVQCASGSGEVRISKDMVSIGTSVLYHRSMALLGDLAENGRSVRLELFKSQQDLLSAQGRRSVGHLILKTSKILGGSVDKACAEYVQTDAIVEASGEGGVDELLKQEEQVRDGSLGLKLLCNIDSVVVDSDCN